MFAKKQFQRVFLVVFSLLVCVVAHAQYANEWIEAVGYNHTFYKFKTQQAGLHRIASSTLQENGIALNGSYFKIFHRGEEIPIYVSTNAEMGENDYIEFYAQTNDGYFDRQLYAQALHQSNPYFSCFEDEGTYFLVASDTANGLRFATADNDLSNVPAKEALFEYSSTTHLSQVFNMGTPKLLNYGADNSSFITSLDAQFSQGEGYGSSTISYFEVGSALYNSKKVAVNTQGVDKLNNGNALVTSRIIGRNENKDIYFDKNFTISVNDVVYISSFASNPTTNADLLLHGYEVKDLVFEIPQTELGDSITEIVFTVYDGVSVSGVPFETEISVGFVSIDYRRSFNFAQESNKKLTVEVPQTAYFEISNLEGGDNPIVYDFTSQKRIVPQVENGIYKFKIEADQNPKHEIFISATHEAALQDVSTLKSRNFQNPNATVGNYILLYNQQLATEACGENQIERYINYRNSQEGGAYQVVAYEIEDLYDIFAHGIDQHPMSIKNCINFAVDKWGVEPQFLNIVGKGVAYNVARFYEQAKNSSLIPSFGHTASDWMLTTKTSHDFAPQIAVGRVPATNCEEVRIYLDKLMVYDNVIAHCQRQEWANNVLQIAKGWHEQENNYFLEILQQQGAIISKAPLNKQIVATLSNDKGKVSPPQACYYEDYFTQLYNTQAQLIPLIENGLNLINYTGHGYGSTWQYPIGIPQDYENEGKYPVILANCDFVANINNYDTCEENRKQTMAEKWIFAEKKGAIAYIGSSNLAYIPLYSILTNEIYTNLNSPNLFDKEIGLSHKKAIEQVLLKIQTGIYSGQAADEALTICSYMTFCGDPAVKLYSPNNKTELSVMASDIQLGNYWVNTQNQTSLTINYTFYNAQQAITANIPLLITQTNSQGTVVYSESYTLESPNNSDTFEFEIPVENNYEGEYFIHIALDSNNEIDENCENNNTASLAVQYFNCNQNTIEIIGNLQICQGDSTLLYLQSNEALSQILWNTNATDSSITVTQAGNYWVQTTAQNTSCTNSTSVTVTYLTDQECTTSILNPIEQHSLTVFPVPATQNLFVKLPNKLLSKWQLSIFSFDGKLLHQSIQTSHKPNIEVNIENLPLGVYWLQATNEQGAAFGAKFIKN